MLYAFSHRSLLQFCTGRFSISDGQVDSVKPFFVLIRLSFSVGAQWRISEMCNLFCSVVNTQNINVEW
jgi:hypothetical protein